MLELNPPQGLGFIVRTAGQDRTEKELSRDMAYLLRLWKVIVRRMQKHSGSDRHLRRKRHDHPHDPRYLHAPTSTPSTWTRRPAFERAKEFLQLVMPRHVGRLHLYDGKEPLFHKYKLEAEIAQIHKREVPLEAGGSIVIDPTEALVAIDVNSGNFRADDSAEETAFQLNLQAAKEIARQLRLRDLGGVIVNDFIDMRKRNIVAAWNEPCATP